MLALLIVIINGNVEMQHRLGTAITGVQCDRRLILNTGVCLHENHLCTASLRDGFQRFDQGPGDAFAPVRRRHGEVVEVDFTARLLELFQLVGGDATDNLTLLEGGQCDNRVAAEQLSPIVFAGAIRIVGIRLIECVTENRQQRFQQRDVVSVQFADVHKGDSGTHGDRGSESKAKVARRTPTKQWRAWLQYSPAQQ